MGRGGLVVTCKWGTFDRLAFKVILGAFGKLVLRRACNPKWLAVERRVPLFILESFNALVSKCHVHQNSHMQDSDKFYIYIRPLNCLSNWVSHTYLVIAQGMGGIRIIFKLEYLGWSVKVEGTKI